MIKVTDKYFIKVSDMSYDVVKEYTNSKGERVQTTLTYHRNIENAIEAIKMLTVRDRLGDQELELSAAINVIRQVNKEFMDILKEVLSDGYSVKHYN